MKKYVIVEARMSSTRLPGKIMLPILGRPSLSLMIERLKNIEIIDGIIIATTPHNSNKVLIDLAVKENVDYFVGSEDDVLSRVLNAAKHFNVDLIIEVTSDCPLVDKEIVTNCVINYLNNNVDYVSNIIKRTYPRGMDVQVFSTNTLNEVEKLTKNPFDKEHVSTYIYNNPDKYKLLNIEAPIELQAPEYRLTLDEAEDYFLIRKIFEELYPIKKYFNYQDIFNFLKSHPELVLINKNIKHKTEQK